MEDKDIMDQTQLAEDLSKKIKYEFRQDFLIKPLDPIMVKKQFDKPVSDEQPKKDENGVEAVDYDKVETEIKEVESDFRKGVVLKLPYEYTQAMKDEKYPSMSVNVGDVVLYKNTAAKWFDLLKDTQLIRFYDIIGVEHTDGVQ